MKEDERKKFEKKKDYRNVEEQKKDTFGVKGKFKSGEIDVTTEVYMKNEKHQLCQSVDEDDVKNTLLKFGVVLHLFEDVSMFKKNMKNLMNTKKTKDKVKPQKEMEKKLIKQKGGPQVKLNQGNFVGRSLPLSPYLSPLKIFFNEQGTNYIEEQNYRKRRDTINNKYFKSSRGRKGTLKIPLGQVPQCYGWKYLSALEALIDDATVDVDFLTGSMSDMLDMSFSSLVTSILEECDEDSARDQQPGAVCPVIQQQTGTGRGCEDECNPEHEGGLADCAAGHFCCRSECGGFRCTRAAGSSRPQKCVVADRFMQCVYQRIDSQICS